MNKSVKLVLNKVASQEFSDRDTRVKLSVGEDGALVFKGTWREDNNAIMVPLRRLPSGAVSFRLNQKTLKRLSRKTNVSLKRGDRYALDTLGYRNLAMGANIGLDVSGVPLMRVDRF